MGCSPDALVKGRNEAVEIKCPTAPVLMKYHLFGLGGDYQAQVQGQMLVGEFSAVHFYAWRPDCPPFYQITKRDEKYLTLLSGLLDAFLERLDECAVIAAKIGHYEVSDFELPIEKLYSDQLHGPFMIEIHDE